MNVQELQERIGQIRHQYDGARLVLHTEQRNRRALRQHLGDVEAAQRIAQKVAQSLQQQAHKKIARVVTVCLQTVFPDMDYAFQIQFKRKQRRTETCLILLKDGHPIDNPLEAESGGVLDVASFALQLSALMLSKPPLRRILIMDEPFKFVSREYRHNVRQMLEKLAQDFDIQFIIATHMEELMMGKVIEL